eukprot:gene9917-2239_t
MKKIEKITLIKKKENVVIKVNRKVKRVKQVYKYRRELSYIPKVTPPHNLTILLLNIFLPGTGTILASFINENPNDFFLLIGWLLSIFWGFCIWKRGRYQHVPSNFFKFLSHF